MREIEGECNKKKTGEVESREAPEVDAKHCNTDHQILASEDLEAGREEADAGKSENQTDSRLQCYSLPLASLSLSLSLSTNTHTHTLSLSLSPSLNRSPRSLRAFVAKSRESEARP